MSVLGQLARGIPPVTLAHDRIVPVEGPLGTRLSQGGLRRGSVLTLSGTTGAGVTSTMVQLVAAVTKAGEWAAVVEPDSSFGARAAANAGVVLERCAFVRALPGATQSSTDVRGHWATVVGALIDGMSLVVARAPEVDIRFGDAQRLAARARERSSILVVVELDDPARRTAAWPAPAATRLTVVGSRWQGLGAGTGRVVDRVVHVVVEERGMRRVADVPAALAS